MAEVKAQLNRLRISPRKVRAVAGLVKGKDVIVALGQLDNFVRRSSPALLKLLNSAIANAENTYQMVRENLYIKDFRVNEGMKLRRFKPKGFGRVSPIQKKTSLIQITLAERVAGLKRQGPEKVSKASDHVHEEGEHSENEKYKEERKDKKPEIKTEIGKKKSRTGLAKRIFQRKSI